MTKRIGTNVNVAGTAQHYSSTINSVTSTILNSSNTSGDEPPKIPGFTTLIVSNISNRDAYIKLQPASVDNDIKGIRVGRNQDKTIMFNGDVYTGEISARTPFGTTNLLLTVF